MIEDGTYDPRYRASIRLFNEREFYECHEVLEDVWLDVVDGTETFYKGLIHLATAFIHLYRGRHGASVSRFASAREYLERFAPGHMGLDVAALVANAADWEAELARGVCAYADERVPRLELAGEPAAD